MTFLRKIIKNLAPYGVTCAWKRKRYGIIEDEPLLYYPGTFKRIKRLIKFSLPYCLSKKVRREYVFSSGIVSTQTIEAYVQSFKCTTHHPLEVLHQRVLIVGEKSIPQCTYYRVRQKVSMLCNASIQVLDTDWSDTVNCLRELQFATAVIFYRVPFFDGVKQIYAEAKRLGLRCGFDVDDLVFEEEAISCNPTFASQTKEMQETLLLGARYYREALQAADFYISSTPALAKSMAKYCKGEGYIVPNAICEDLYAPVFKYPTAIEGQVVIGYGAGSATHDEDFKECSGALLRILREYPQTLLVIHGKLALGSEFDEFKNRIRRVSFVPFAEYANALARFDVNLIPLLSMYFNDCKSNIKYLEASRFGIASVASPCAEFTSVIRDGENGFIAHNEDEWYNALRALVESASLRKRIGAAARETVMKRFSGDVVWRDGLAAAVKSCGDPAEYTGERVLHVSDAPMLKLDTARDVLFSFMGDASNELDVVRHEVDGVSAFAVKGRRNTGNEFETDATVVAAFQKVLEAVRPVRVVFHDVREFGIGLIEECVAKGVAYEIEVTSSWWFCPKQTMCSKPRVDLYECAQCCDCKNLFLRWNKLHKALKGAVKVIAADEFTRQLCVANGIEVTNAGVV